MKKNNFDFQVERVVMYYEGHRGPTIGNGENNDRNEQNPRNKKEEDKKRNITTLLNALWHYIKYNFSDRYRKETDKKTAEVLKSEQFDLELTNFVTKLNNLEKLFLNSDFNNNSIDNDDSRFEFLDEIDKLTNQFNEQNQFGISLYDVKDNWQTSKMLMITARYKKYTFLINYTKDTRFKVEHPWSL